MQEKYRIIFLGTPEFAVPSIKALAENGMKPVLIVSQEDKAQGRKREIIKTPTHAIAEELDIPCFQPRKVRDKVFYETLQSYKPDFLITAAYGRLLTKEVLSLPTIEALNIHASLLPKYRGASPVHHALINNDEKTGVSIMRMVEEMDKGPVFLQEEYKIPDGMRTDALMEALAHEAAAILPQCIEEIAQGKREAIAQEEEKASYVSFLDKNTGQIQWNRSAKEIEGLVRGTYPWPCAFADFDGKRVKILQAKAFTKEEVSDIAIPDEAIAGDVLSTKEKKIWILCAEGILRVEELQFAGSRRMSSEDCAHNFHAGMSFADGVIN